MSKCLDCKRYNSTKPINCINITHEKIYETNKNKAREHMKKLRSSEEGRLKQNFIVRKSRQKLRLEILQHYGIKCSCCGYNNINKKIHGQSFLNVDHVNGKGTTHINLIKQTGDEFYHWLKSNEYPVGYRILCKPCNNGMEPGDTICELHKWELKRAT